MTPADIVQCLEAGAESDLIGEPETEHLDFKGQPYLLGGEKGRWELAKDVAALANSGGGCLVIGVTTVVPADREEEVAAEIKPFPAGLVDVQQMRATIDAASGVYPVVKRVEIRRFTRDEGRALALVLVPLQDDDDLPFIVVRMVEGDEKRGVGVGIPIRSGPHTYWVPPGQLHRDLSDGRRARSVPHGLPESRISTMTPAGIRDRADAQLNAIEQYMGWSEAPTLMLATIPVRPQQSPIEGLYDRDRIYGCVASPPSIRHAGFSLAWASEPENVNGALVNATAERQILWVDTDGASFAGAAGFQEFLTRSGGTRVAQEPEARNINATVLVEWTYLFFKFVNECVAPSIDGGMRFVVRLTGAKSRPWQLRMVEGPSSAFSSAGHPAGIDDLFADGDVSGVPEKDAFTALARVYGAFGLGPQHIAYSIDGQVDPALIVALE